jgi:hypothetical protein
LNESLRQIEHACLERGINTAISYKHINELLKTPVISSLALDTAKNSFEFSALPFVKLPNPEEEIETILKHVITSKPDFHYVASPSFTSQKKKVERMVLWSFSECPQVNYAYYDGYYNACYYSARD